MLKLILKTLIKTFTSRRLLNILKITISYYLSLLIKKPIVWGYPPIVMIEPTNYCNLMCPMCPTGNGTLKRQKGYMAFETFQKLVDEIYEDSFMLLLWNQGEPFLNPDFYKMIEYADSKKLLTMSSTNANIMPVAEKIINSKLDILIFSMDGITQETYNSYVTNSKIISELLPIIFETDLK